MEKNVGLLDRYIRITGGLFMLGYGIKEDSNPLIFLGASKIAEGIVRWCPLLYALDISTMDDNLFSTKMKTHLESNVDDNMADINNMEEQ
ncbi:MAG: DUF2892 domain-containing protein [Xylanivirga thermophila]|jgi:hypothetical protein|uniref:YgaP family membrane protein n=1 Tax=Xylanivirga thermophila TaxID=2496273 RepID=UPI00101BE6E8|nr:DUF2892 domain-containing protein [Xylanivirga thermophila]